MARGRLEERKGPVVLALGPGEEGAALLAEAGGLALSSERGLACVTVDDGGRLSAEAQARLGEYYELARASGASVARVPGIDRARALADYAEAEDAPALVVGTGRLAGRDTASRLMAARRGFAVVAVSFPGGSRSGRRIERRWAAGGSAAQCLAALLTVGCVTLLGLALASYAGYWSAAILYLAAISIGALRLDPGPVLLAALASALAWDYLFIPPRFHLAISRPEDVLMLALYFVVSLTAGLAASRLRSSESLLRAEHERVSRINALALSLAGAPSIRAALDRGLSSLRDAMDCKAIAMLAGEAGSLKDEPEDGWEALDASARSAADRAFREGVPAGRFTRLEGSSEWRFVALESPRGRLGVIGIRPARDARWDESSETCLRTYASTIAIALAREA
jgi:two-component system, OmpR family, sensor histidine kinase KdpD